MAGGVPEVFAKRRFSPSGVSFFPQPALPGRPLPRRARAMSPSGRALPCPAGAPWAEATALPFKKRTPEATA
jgi:hypothetical protein